MRLRLGSCGVRGARRVPASVAQWRWLGERGLHPGGVSGALARLAGLPMDEVLRSAADALGGAVSVVDANGVTHSAGGGLQERVWLLQLPDGRMVGVEAFNSDLRVVLAEQAPRGLRSLPLGMADVALDTAHQALQNLVKPATLAGNGASEASSPTLPLNSLEGLRPASAPPADSTDVGLLSSADIIHFGQAASSAGWTVATGNVGRMRQRMHELGLDFVDVGGGGDCFYLSMLFLASDHIRTHVFGGRSLDGSEAVERLRGWLADRLADDFAVANAGLLPRYNGFIYEQGVDHVAQQQGWLDDVATLTSWDNDLGDMVSEVMARELGAPMLLVQDGYTRELGPAGAARIAIVRRPGHYQGGVWTIDTPNMPWATLRPAPPSDRAEAEGSWQAIVDRTRSPFDQLRGEIARRLSGLPAATAARATAELDNLALRRTFALGSPQLWDHLAPPLRAGARVTELHAVNAGLRMLLDDVGPRPSSASRRSPAPGSTSVAPPPDKGSSSNGEDQTWLRLPAGAPGALKAMMAVMAAFQAARRSIRPCRPECRRPR